MQEAELARAEIVSAEPDGGELAWTADLDNVAREEEE
jgi:hypothetical protein